MKENDEIMKTTPVRIDVDILDLVRNHKIVTGFPIQRFIEDAIVEKIYSLPVDVQKKMGLKKKSKKQH